MSPDLRVEGLGVRIDGDVVLDDLSFSLPAGGIHGLLGRNGAGKTTLLGVVAAMRRPSAGRVLVGGREPWEDASVTSQVIGIGDRAELFDTERLGDVLAFAAEIRADWDSEVAERLMDRFGLRPRQRYSSLSRGERSAAGIVRGLASRSPLTLLDEPTLGLDAPARAVFAEELLAEQAAHPRTVVLSTHLIDEVAPLLERVVIIDAGRLVIEADADALRGQGLTVTGPREVVSQVLVGHHVSAERELGRTVSATVLGSSDELTRAARHAELDVSPISLQELFNHLTSSEAST